MSDGGEYVIKTKVIGIKYDKNLGLWFVLFDGSWEWLGLDAEQPTLKVTDPVDIIIRKRFHAQSN